MLGFNNLYLFPELRIRQHLTTSNDKVLSSSLCRERLRFSQRRAMVRDESIVIFQYVDVNTTYWIFLAYHRAQ